jgi:hypothetical protein
VLIVTLPETVPIDEAAALQQDLRRATKPAYAWPRRAILDQWILRA